MNDSGTFHNLFKVFFLSLISLSFLLIGFLTVLFSCPFTPLQVFLFAECSEFSLLDVSLLVCVFAPATVEFEILFVDVLDSLGFACISV